MSMHDEIIQKEFRFLRNKDLVLMLSIKKATVHRWVNAGLLPEPIIFPGGRIRAWPDYEIQEISSALISQQSDESIRKLVKELVEKRGDYTLPRTCWQE